MNQINMLYCSRDVYSLSSRLGREVVMAYRVTDSCIACGSCVDVCPMGAITLGDDKATIDENVCISCGACAGECPVEAIEEG